MVQYMNAQDIVMEREVTSKQGEGSAIPALRKRGKGKPFKKEHATLLKS